MIIYSKIENKNIIPIGVWVNPVLEHAQSASYPQPVGTTRKFCLNQPIQSCTP